MRKIKFRGMDKEGLWYYGLVTYQDKEISEISGYNSNSFWTVTEVYSSTIGQFIGEYDCQGKEIYEGDILDIGNITVKVCFMQGSFTFVTNSGWKLCGDSHRWAKIIGNIYNNPELLNEKRADK